MSQPLIKYTLTKQGRQPEWLSSDSRAFKGQHGASANKPGKLPRFGSPQDTIFLGIAAGDPDSDGTPDGYVGTIDSKADLETYIRSVGTEYKVTTSTLTGIQTATTTGLSTAWAAVNTEEGYQGGLSTSTTTKRTASGVGTVATFTGSGVVKIVTASVTGSGSTSTTVETPITVDPASTLTITGVSTSVGVTTTGNVDTGITTTTTTTTTNTFSHTDVNTQTSTSKSETTTDGVTTRTDKVTTSEYTNYETSYDFPTEATRLWDIHEAINT